jgi:mRNA export factor
VSTVQLPDKVYSMDVVHPLMVVACANRTLQIFDLNNPGVIFKVRRQDCTTSDDAHHLLTS